MIYIIYLITRYCTADNCMLIQLHEVNKFYSLMYVKNKINVIWIIHAFVLPLIVVFMSIVAITINILVNATIQTWIINCCFGNKINACFSTWLIRISSLDISSQPSMKIYLISIYCCTNFVAITVKGSIGTFDVYFVWSVITISYRFVCTKLELYIP